jgi:ABC-2 type transport system permease protein
MSNNPWLYWLYLADPLAPAVLLIQRAFWLPTFLTDSQIGYPDMPHHYWLLGLVSLAGSIVALGLCQLAFRRLENKIAERV